MKRTYYADPQWMERAIGIELIGCGGTGSSMLDELFRMHSLLIRLDHPGLSVRAWDGDEVTEANIGRQRFWPSDVGFNKAELLISRYSSFGGVDWRYQGRDVEQLDLVSMRTDVVITCVDRPEVRVMVGDVGCAHGKSGLWIDTGNDDQSGQVVMGDWMGRSAKKANLANVLDLYPSLRTQKTDERASCSVEESISRQDFGINQRVAAEASALLWRLVRYGQINRHGSFVYQEQGEVIPLEIDEDIWRSFAA